MEPEDRRRAAPHAAERRDDLRELDRQRIASSLASIRGTSTKMAATAANGAGSRLGRLYGLHASRTPRRRAGSTSDRAAATRARPATRGPLRRLPEHRGLPPDREQIGEHRAERADPPIQRGKPSVQASRIIGRPVGDVLPRHRQQVVEPEARNRRAAPGRGLVSPRTTPARNARRSPGGTASKRARDASPQTVGDRAEPRPSAPDPKLPPAGDVDAPVAGGTPPRRSRLGIGPSRASERDANLQERAWGGARSGGRSRRARSSSSFLPKRRTRTGTRTANSLASPDRSPRRARERRGDLVSSTLASRASSLAFPTNSPVSTRANARRNASTRVRTASRAAAPAASAAGVGLAAEEGKREARAKRGSQEVRRRHPSEEVVRPIGSQAHERPELLEPCRHDPGTASSSSIEPNPPLAVRNRRSARP